VRRARCIDGSRLPLMGEEIFRAPSIPDPARPIALADFLAGHATRSTRRAHAKNYTRVNTILALHYCKRDRLKAKFGRLTTYSGANTRLGFCRTY
jgi:hypothetical protein